MDATDIVDVVGDFVSLKRRGANHWGLCPFHNDRSPSFSVNSAKGIFKCFSCGKAGSAVSFLMDLEGMTYVEAIKWLGKKYNIEVKEREMTGAEREAEAARESLYAVNDMAMKHFEHTLESTADGRDIGLAYFTERGLNEATIKKFHLGYSLEKGDDLYRAAIAAGFDERYLIETGLCVKQDSGRVYDRFRGRVIYPVHSLSGRVVAFGGRTLKKEKTVAKYVNSPESAIYSKSRELYGMYQARSAIARAKKCILVEGYMDVLSMHQAGVENVVASSGTALTEGQVAMIKRFSNSVTLMYDSDAAGIKAALRGVNMFIAAGLELKLVLLPPGDDPDSFAQSHTSTEVEQYIADNEQDLIGFMTDTLLADAGDNPRARSEAINRIIESISLIPNVIEQTLYIEECSRKVGIPARTLSAQLKTVITRRAEDEYNARQRRQAAETIVDIESQPAAATDTTAPATAEAPATAQSRIPHGIEIAERDIVQYILRYGLMYLCDAQVGDNIEPMTTLSYIDAEFELDNLDFSVPVYKKIRDLAREIARDGWQERHDALAADLAVRRDREIAEGRQRLIDSGAGTIEIEQEEPVIIQTAENHYNESLDDFDAAYVRDILLRSDDRTLVDTVVALTADPVVLSKMHPVIDRRDEVVKKLPIAVYAYKGAILKERIADLVRRLGDPGEDSEVLLGEIMKLKEASMEFDLYNGEMVITPLLRR